jgi:hypothetical protein
VRQVESVQRHFTKRLPGLNNMNYDDRLAILGIEKLELRRLKQDLIIVYKILFGLVDIDAKEIFTVRNANHVMRGHPYTLLQGTAVLMFGNIPSLSALLKYGTACLQCKMTSVVLKNLSRF